MPSARTRNEATAAMSAAMLADFEGELGGKYEMQEVIGSGGMGKVVRARHRQLNQLVAIKFLHAELIRDEFVPRFLREARSAAKITSPHVTRVLDVGVSAGGMPFIVMEYLDGEDLGRWIATKGAMPLAQAVSCMLQVLLAISEAHAKGIVHRDLKPGNFFATRSPRGDLCIKVLDFGLAKRMSGVDTFDAGMTEPGTLVGSPSYMSPEQFLDAQDVDERSDIWAIGASLYELISGAPPFRGANLPQLYAAVVHGPIKGLKTAVPTVPDALDAVIAKCLTRNREGRFESAEQLAEALAPFAEASGIRSAAEAPAPAPALLSAAAITTRVDRGAGSELLESGVAVAQPLEPADAGTISDDTARTTLLSSSGLPPRALVRPRPLGPRLLGAAFLAAAAGAAAWLVLADEVPNARPPVARRSAPVTATATVAPPPVLTVLTPPAHVPSPGDGDPVTKAAAPRISAVPLPLRRPAPVSATSAPSSEAPASTAPSVYEKYP
jgi:serine/threonine protein kinase